MLSPAPAPAPAPDPDHQHAEFVAHAAAGHLDALGQPFSRWRLARYHDDGRAVRDANGHQVFERQADWLARRGGAINKLPAPVQQEMF
ncbi:hypothetical protein [Aquabacterium sp. OR-4]|uniref:hypothetical protein n=1 Tax=Aquabacterium sp. OR-4 TaxID=2978127 RepID=UPI0021B1FAFB|nr:hypothetical protein [Aquabacterium sp. OR-4]MDT7836485.1 hypothetical protein [Aquabacterium sp. OR-4]